VKSKEELAPPAEQNWTRPEVYFEALARRRTARRKREPGAGARTQPESPRLLLSTFPFIALIAALGLLTIAIMVAAWPGRPQRQPPPPQHEQGVASKGWFQEAEREFR
jgi:hypothetical protein